VKEILRIPRIGYIDDRRAVQLVMAGQRIERRQRFGARQQTFALEPQRMMPSEEDVPAEWIFVNCRLIGRSLLEVIGSDELHVVGGRPAGTGGTHNQKQGGRRGSRKPTIFSD
jgi:hypothetical protein